MSSIKKIWEPRKDDRKHLIKIKKDAIISLKNNENKVYLRELDTLRNKSLGEIIKVLGTPGKRLINILGNKGIDKSEEDYLSFEEFEKVKSFISSTLKAILKRKRRLRLEEEEERKKNKKKPNNQSKKNKKIKKAPKSHSKTSQLFKLLVMHGTGCTYDDVNQQEREFLEQHDILEAELFNAKGFKTNEYKEMMKSTNKLFAINTTPCTEKGHTIRSRAGHCIQCNTIYIAYMKRHSSRGFVYIAGSINGQLIKVGYTKKIENRQESLNRTKYAQKADWEILCSVDCVEAGKLETILKMGLKKHSYKILYSHSNHLQTTDEVFKCSYQKAYEVLNETLRKRKINTSIKESKVNKSLYRFKNLVPKGEN